MELINVTNGDQIRIWESAWNIPQNIGACVRHLGVSVWKWHAQVRTDTSVVNGTQNTDQRLGESHNFRQYEKKYINQQEKE